MGDVGREEDWEKLSVSAIMRERVQCLLCSLFARGKKEFMYPSVRQCITLILSLLPDM
jgi:hypothetical protein